MGVGTGSLSLLLAQLGHRVTGVDLSPNMVERARRKLAAANVDVRVLVGDAADPPLGGDFDVVLVAGEPAECGIHQALPGESHIQQH